MLVKIQGGKLGQIEAEIRQEKAEALGRMGERLAEASAKLLDLRSELAALGVTQPDRSLPRDLRQTLTDRLAAWTEWQAAAQRLRYDLIVQREACGLWRHEDVDRLYPIPVLPDTLTSTNPEEVP